MSSACFSGLPLVDGIVGRSPAMLRVCEQIQRIAPYYRVTLIQGATGTGKELTARAMHVLSRRAGGPFVPFNCAAVPDGLFESEMFGHAQGAYTGATKEKEGIFEHANTGTLFLDEISELSPAGQAKLLRVIESGEIYRLGSVNPKRVDLSVIAATNRDLPGMISKGLFRADLYHRLSMLTIRLPRLAERLEDIPLLCQYFLQKCAVEYQKPLRSVSSRALHVLLGYNWPGNVRELQNWIGHACLFSEGGIIDVRDLPQFPASSDSDANPGRQMEWRDEPEEKEAGSSEDKAPSLRPLAVVEIEHILGVLEKVGGNKILAASILGIGKTTLYRKLQELRAAEGIASAAE